MLQTVKLELMNTSQIPEGAVEVAAKAYCADLAQLGHPLWGDLMEAGRLIRLESMRAVLEAAAPHMLAPEYDRGYDVGYRAGYQTYGDE